jgi:hypothetical protein
LTLLERLFLARVMLQGTISTRGPGFIPLTVVKMELARAFPFVGLAAPVQDYTLLLAPALWCRAITDQEAAELGARAHCT